MGALSSNRRQGISDRGQDIFPSVPHAFLTTMRDLPSQSLRGIHSHYKLNTTDKVIAVLTGRSLFSPGVHFGEAETTLTAS